MARVGAEVGVSRILNVKVRARVSVSYALWHDAGEGLGFLPRMRYLHWLRTDPHMACVPPLAKYASSTLGPSSSCNCHLAPVVAVPEPIAVVLTLTLALVLAIVLASEC